MFFNNSVNVSTKYELDYAFFVVGSIVSTSNRTIDKNDNIGINCMSLSEVLVVNGSQTIEVRTRLNSNNGSYNIFERNLFILKIG